MIIEAYSLCPFISVVLASEEGQQRFCERGQRGSRCMAEGVMQTRCVAEGVNADPQMLCHSDSQCGT